MNICIFGASGTWGANDHELGGWVERLKLYCLESFDDVTVYNLGVSGDNTIKLLRRFAVEAAARKPDLIVFSIGTNDSQSVDTIGNHRVPPENFEINLGELRSAALKYTNKIVFVGLPRVDEKRTMPIPWSPTKYYDNSSLAKYDGIVQSFCEKNAIPWVDISQLLTSDDLDDGLHPNARGHQKIFVAVRNNLKSFTDKNE